MVERLDLRYGGEAIAFKLSLDERLGNINHRPRREDHRLPSGRCMDQVDPRNTRILVISMHITHVAHSNSNVGWSIVSKRTFQTEIYFVYIAPEPVNEFETPRGQSLVSVDLGDR